MAVSALSCAWAAAVAMAAAVAPPAPALSPAEEQKTFAFKDGFGVELVAAEPMVEDPVALTFDEEGRIWVVEMRGFMPDVEARGELEPIGRITVLEDTNDDGRADRRTVFLDGLVLPRGVAVVSGGALVAHGGKLWFARDRDGDLRADGQEVVDANYAQRGESPEHQANGLVRALDNRIYNAKSTARYRRAGGRFVRDEVEFRGQWGLSQDDWGRLYYNYNWDQLRADLVPANVMGRNPANPSTQGINVQVIADQRVFPARPTTGVNRGDRPYILDERGRLKEFTAAGAPTVYRGDAYPPAFRGNVFVCEPAANLVKRDIVVDDGLTFTARLAYEGAEIWTSTDERFRPVNAHLAPDGTLYVVDMYRGTIQHAKYITPHLRREILARGLERPLHRGRIWRLVGPDRRRGPRPRLLRASDADLVATLRHANGWWRDTAQRLLVERGARAQAPALARLAADTNADPRARVHALWTLEGLAYERPEALLPLVEETGAPKVQVAAVRVIEALSHEPESSRQPELRSRPTGARRAPVRAELVRRLEAVEPTAAPEVRLASALVLGAHARGEQPLPTLARILGRHGAHPLVRDAVLSGLAGRELALLGHVVREPAFARDETLAPALQGVAAAVVRAGGAARVEAILELAASEAGPRRGSRTEQQSGPRRGTSPRPTALAPNWRATALLRGILESFVELEANPVRFARRPTSLARLSEVCEASGDAVFTSVFTRVGKLLAWPGHEPPPPARPPVKPLKPAEVSALRGGRDVYLQTCASCHGARGEGLEAMGPPLAGSEWAAGAPERVARIVLFGVEGAINVRGERYAPPRIMPNMPAVVGLGDDVLSLLLSYVGRAFGGRERRVDANLVRRVRDETVGREAPYTEVELLKIASPRREYEIDK